MRKSGIVVLLVVCLSVQLVDAHELACVSEAPELSVVLEQQPVVQCCALFSDVTVKIARQWFKVLASNASSEKPSDKPARRDNEPGLLSTSSIVLKTTRLLHGLLLPLFVCTVTSQALLTGNGPPGFLRVIGLSLPSLSLILSLIALPRGDPASSVSFIAATMEARPDHPVRVFSLPQLGRLQLQSLLCP